MSKSIDSTFLHYGIKQEDMRIIAQACIDEGIDEEWMKEYILKEYTQEKNNNESELDVKKVSKILKKALKQIKS